MSKSKMRTTSSIQTVATKVAGALPFLLASMCVSPAILFNVDWSPTTPLAWKVAPTALILGSALFVESACRARSYVLTPLFFAIAVLLMTTNVLSAFNNATHRTGDRSDHRRGMIAAAEQAKQQRSQWSQARAEAVKLAGEAPVASIRADIEQAISADARRWQATGQCDPLKTTAGASMTFCSGVATIKKRLGAAEQRDRIDQQLARLNTTAATIDAPASADPFADNLAAFLGAIGFQMSDSGKQLISTQRDILLALCLELLATFGPTAALLIFSGRELSIAHGAAKPTKQTAPVEAAELAPAAQAAAAPIDTHVDFMAARLEPCEGASIRAGEAWELWLQWCSEQGLEPGTQKRFGARMKADFAHDKTNNRPRYLGVRVKRGAPALKIVSAA